jgi:dCTP deaminase
VSFWGGAQLLKDGAKIVHPFDAGIIDCSALTLTLGAEAYVTPGMGDNARLSVKKMLEEPKQFGSGPNNRKRGGGTVVVPPGQFGFLLTEEVIKIPKNAMGFISLKSKPKFGGLINVSGFHVDPGFEGNLIFSVFNAGPSAIHLARGDQLFLLWIADLSGAVDSKFYKKVPGYFEIPSEVITRVARENHSLQALSERTDKLESEMKFVKSGATGIVAFLGLLAAWFALAPLIWPDKPPSLAPNQPISVEFHNSEVCKNDHEGNGIRDGCGHSVGRTQGPKGVR